MKNGCANYITTLTIAGSDSCGGAGVQADVKTMSALGCYAATAITAITVQNTLGVTAVHAVPPEIVAGQIRVVMDDIRPRAVKVGMVNDTATIIAIADVLKDYDVEHIVVDPVMVATSGSRLMQDDAVEVFCKQLLPLATLLTPNIPETEVLSGITVSDKESMDSAALRILQLGCSNLLVKGGHLEGKKIDRLYGEVEREYVGENVVTRNTHGTGCTLSSAIASNLAKGFTLAESVKRAKDYISGALAAMLDLGKGSGPMNHNFDLNSDFAKEKESV